MSHRVSIPVLLALAIPAAHAATCESLATLALPHTKIDLAEARPAGEFTLPGVRPIANLPAFCRVTGALHPSADSDIRFEVWLPQPDKWNSKFQGVGNGGFAGSITFSGLADAVRHGYATASTDTGHKDRGESARWALNHPEKIADFGYRAIHETAVTAKAVIHAYYGDTLKRSYFNSCSNGGRQALMEAQRFPDDYDGILAGAPGNNRVRLNVGFLWSWLAANGNPGATLPASKLPLLQKAVVSACDELDGVKDGIIGDPRRAASIR